MCPFWLCCNWIYAEIVEEYCSHLWWFDYASIMFFAQEDFQCCDDNRVNYRCLARWLVYIDGDDYFITLLCWGKCDFSECNSFSITKWFRKRSECAFQLITWKLFVYLHKQGKNKTKENGAKNLVSNYLNHYSFLPLISLFTHLQESVYIRTRPLKFLALMSSLCSTFEVSCFHALFCLAHVVQERRQKENYGWEGSKSRRATQWARPHPTYQVVFLCRKGSPTF